jgi:hypothetical protein
MSSRMINDEQFMSNFTVKINNNFYIVTWFVSSKKSTINRSFILHYFLTDFYKNDSR